MNINEYLKNLEDEIKQTKEDIDKEASLNRLKEIAKVYNGEDKIISSTELVEKIKNRKDEFKVMSEIPTLDSLLKGFRLQQLIVISAPTKNGKTSFCIDLTTKMPEHHPLWIPFEEGAEELIQKFIDREESPPLFYFPATNAEYSLPWVEKKIIEAISKYDSRVIFIDHLDFIVPMGGDRHDLRVGQAMRALKGLAKKWNIIIFVISHLTKTRPTEQPDINDLRNSSYVAQEADTVIMLWRQSKRQDGEIITTDNTTISVQANRRFGKTGNIKTVFKDGKFIEEEWKSYKNINAYEAF